MQAVSMLTFRRNAERIIRRVLQGERLVLTYRGRPAVRMEPVGPGEVTEEDPFYAIDQIAVKGGKSMTNREIDEAVYEA